MITVADLSEWNGAVDWLALAAWQRSQFHAAVDIIRAWSGYRPDNYWTRNRANAHTAGVDALGIYAYLPAGSDPAAQAHGLIGAVGRLLPNEWLILDLEEGSGDQSGIVRAWMSTVQAGEPRPGWLYTGVAWWRAHNLAADGLPANRTWIAAYQSGEPSAPAHGLWQFTDSATVPGVSGPCDLSRFDGTLPDLLAAVGAPAPAERPTPSPAPPPVEDDMNTSSDTTGRAGLSWSAGSKSRVQVGLNEANIVFKLNVQLVQTTGPVYIPEPWVLADGTGVYEIPAQYRANCRGVILTWAPGSASAPYDVYAE